MGPHRQGAPRLVSSLERAMIAHEVTLDTYEGPLFVHLCTCVKASSAQVSIGRQMETVRKFMKTSEGSHLTIQRHRPTLEPFGKFWIVRVKCVLPNLNGSNVERVSLGVLALATLVDSAAEQRKVRHHNKFVTAQLLRLAANSGRQGPTT